MLRIDPAKAFDLVCHSISFKLLEHVGVGSVILNGVQMAYDNCSAKLTVNRELTRRINVCSSVRQGCPFHLYHLLCT